MPYEIPASPFNASEWAANKLIHTQQVDDGIVELFCKGYRVVWGVSGDMQDVTDADDVTTQQFVGGGSAHTQEEMQAIITAMGSANVTRLLTRAGEMRDAIIAIDPTAMLAPYQQPAFALSFSETDVVVGPLLPAWVPPIVPEAVPSWF